MYVEESICEIDGKLVIHHETLKKLKRKLEIVQQMNVAADVYASAIVEVVRRKTFTEHFLEVSAPASVIGLGDCAEVMNEHRVLHRLLLASSGQVA